MAQCSRASLTRVQLLGSFWLSVYQRISSALIFCLFVLQSVVKVKLFHMRVQQLVEVFKSSFRGIEKNHRHTNGEKLQIYDFRETITSKINVCGKKKREKSFQGLLSPGSLKKLKKEPPGGFQETKRPSSTVEMKSCSQLWHISHHLSEYESDTFSPPLNQLSSDAPAVVRRRVSLMWVNVRWLKNNLKQYKNWKTLYTLY